MTPTLSDTPPDREPSTDDDVEKLVEERRDELERIAASDLPFAPRARAALDRVGGRDE